MSRSDKTQAFYDQKVWWKHYYQCFDHIDSWCPHEKDYPGSYYNYYSYPRAGFKVPHKWTRSEIKKYWNSEKNKAKRVMERHETPEPSRHRHGAQWDAF